jgi:hypothetical protein
MTWVQITFGPLEHGDQIAFGPCEVMGLEGLSTYLSNGVDQISRSDFMGGDLR